MGEAVALRTSRVRIVILERRTVIEQLLMCLAVVHGRFAQFIDARRLERLLDLRVRSECS